MNRGVFVHPSVRAERESYKLLGNNAKSVDTVDGKRQRLRGERFALQRVAQRLLPASRVARCMCGLKAGSGTVRVVEGVEGRCSFRGVETCGSVWHCPVCSRRISEVRRGELNQLLAWAREVGGVPHMVTLTMRHSRDESLKATLDRLKEAKKRFHQSRTWRAVAGGVMGHVTATEVTHGANGWHPHMHLIVIFTPEAVTVFPDLAERLEVAWLESLDTAGGSGNGHAFSIQPAEAAGEYITKWGAACEMVLSGVKRAGGQSRNVWQLLDDAGRGDKQAAAIWLEYAEVFRGRRQLVWSRGLKERVGIDDIVDGEIVDVDDVVLEGEQLVIELDAASWRSICRAGAQSDLLSVCENRTSIRQVRDWIWYIRLEMEVRET